MSNLTKLQQSFEMMPYSVIETISKKFLFLIVFILTIFVKEQALSLNSVLDINGTYPYLINKTSNEIIQPRDYMDFENLYTPNEAYKINQTAQGRNYHLLKAFDFANYFQSDYWHYSDENELRLSAQPIANEFKCAQQLDWLERKLNGSSNVLFSRGEQHVNLMSLIDSFGKPESGTYLGHGYWLGSYFQCKRTSINIDKFEEEECRINMSSSESCKQFKSSNSHRESSNIQNNHKILPLHETNTKININTRYCMGKVRDIDWPSEKEDNYVPTISYKVGLCLPEVCETLSIKRHREQLERLMRYNMAEHYKSRLYLYDMYCSPDPRSPIREYKLSSRIFLGLISTWLLILCLSTVIYSCFKRNQKDLKNILSDGHNKEDQELCQELTNSNFKDEIGLANSCGLIDIAYSGRVMNDCDENTAAKMNKNYLEHKTTTPVDTKTLSSAQLLLIKAQNSFSPICKDHNQHHHHRDLQATTTNTSTNHQLNNRPISSNLSTTSSTFSNWLNLSEYPITMRILQALSIKENIREFQQPPLLLREPGSSKKLRINLNSLDAIKCLCCVLVIFGHIIFIHMQHLSNILHTMEISLDLYPRFLIAFFNFVDTFFIISGMLTAYFIFKRFNEKTFKSPMVWLSISFLRLLRLSPVYLLVFWFTKTMTVYLSEGPIWDYGTDKNSIKGLCINDHWWKSLLYLGNLGTMQPLCILPAWSIIVDAQYSLIIPPILYLIFKNKKLGYIFLIISILVSTANMSHQLATQTAVKTSDMAKIRLHVYPLISRFAAEFYNTAWNRIGPVAIGILGGHMLYKYDIGKIRQWPWFMRGSSFKLILLLHLLIIILPVISRLTDDPETNTESDLTIFVLSNSTIKPIWSLINTIFLLRLVTDLKNHSVLARLMSHNIWHCLGKLCFASYLIHYELILILLKSREEGLLVTNWSNAAREFSLAFLASTSISYFVYILYEAPINKLINLALAKPKYLRKIEDESIKLGG